MKGSAKLHKTRTTMLLWMLACCLPAMAAPKLAVNLSYDDALESQLSQALPVLEQYQIAASFYLVPANPGFRQHTEQWQRVAALGHELGNHTYTHPCRGSLANREWVVSNNDLDSLSATALKQQVVQANAALQALDGRQRRSFTPPCGDKLAQGTNYWPLVEEDVSFIKGVGLPEGVEVIWAPENVSGQALIDFVRQQPDSVKMVSFIFHGVGGDYLQVSSEAHAALVSYLAAHRDRYYVDTYQNIRDWYKNQPQP